MKKSKMPWIIILGIQNNNLIIPKQITLTNMTTQTAHKYYNF